MSAQQQQSQSICKLVKTIETMKGAYHSEKHQIWNDNGSMDVCVYCIHETLYSNFESYHYIYSL